MKARIKLGTAPTPDGGELALYQHDLDFYITINGHDLMHSRQYESELELARLACRHLAGSLAPSVLIGGLGMGYTLRQALDMLGPDARVVVGDLVGAVVEWNREFLGALNGQPLADPRVELRQGDVVELIAHCVGRFDAILIDIDNGPDPLTDAGNRRLYGPEGLQACRRALAKKGCLAVWSAEPNRKFEHLLMRCGFQVRRFRVAAGKGSKSQSRFIWVASEDESVLPPGGGEPRLPVKKAPDRYRRGARRR
jgi:spermidine synthase